MDKENEDTSREAVSWSIEGDRTVLFPAFIKAQKAYGQALKGETNPHFGKKYADLADVLQATKGPLNESGFGVLWFPETLPSGWHRLTFMLAHESGGHIAASLDFPTQGNVHELKSAFTYRRRILGECVMGVAPEDDDDGNAAAGKGEQNDRQRPPEPRREQKPAPKPARPQAPANDAKGPAEPPREPQAAPSAPKPPSVPPPLPQRPAAPATGAATATQKTQAQALLRELGYVEREQGSERMLSLIGKRFGDEITAEELSTFVTGLRQEKLLRKHLGALEYTGDLELERIRRDYDDEADAPEALKLMGPEDLAKVLGSLEREAKIRNVEVA